ncbi:hypothetical protein, unlikely [Trypanosoma congolense IL3000]|uniref:Uncharacterized protein n=1 Tax=Trypanosoma congolense (strain IL3000) TaxID=1068625 RepID=F9WE97_TRYCI|nr:hypothetical protein, unlikely [Trypanosoma congolense IL3000]
MWRNYWLALGCACKFFMEPFHRPTADTLHGICMACCVPTTSAVCAMAVWLPSAYQLSGSWHLATQARNGILSKACSDVHCVFTVRYGLSYPKSHLAAPHTGRNCSILRVRQGGASQCCWELFFLTGAKWLSSEIQLCAYAKTIGK